MMTLCQNIAQRTKGAFPMSKKVLVAYFSASGVTARAAKEIAQSVGGDLYEIRPAQPYTKADLDWTNKQSRSSLEMNDPASRPAMADRVMRRQMMNGTK